MEFIYLFLFTLFHNFDGSSCVSLYATFSMEGISGKIMLHQQTIASDITIDYDFNSNVNASEYSIEIATFPVDYTNNKQCADVGKTIHRLPEAIIIPGDGRVILDASDLDLMGEKSIWGRSVVVKGANKICATIQMESKVEVAEARFMSPVAGSVWFHWTETSNNIIGTVFADLADASHEIPKSSSHKWSVFATDILQQKQDKSRQSCNFLQILYDPDTRDDSMCSQDNPSKCKVGDMSGKHGELKVGATSSRFSKRFFTDLNLSLPDLTGSRSLYLVLFDPDDERDIYACALIRLIQPRQVSAQFMSDGVLGYMSFTQSTPFLPTTSEVHLHHLQNIAGGYHVHMYPVPPRERMDHSVCSETGSHFNPYNIADVPAENSTQDLYEVGDLSNKYGSFVDSDLVELTAIDHNLPLFGINSIIGRSIVIHKATGERWICANIKESHKVITAVAQFRYPVIGRIVFTQEADDPLSETSVFVESLLYSDGSTNYTKSHRWHVHTEIPGRDFYNWTMRCQSAGGHFNPHRVSLEEKGYSRCGADNTVRCEIGDLTSKHGRLEVTGEKAMRSMTRRFYVDPNLPLSGSHSIVGRSIVIHDDFAPEHRGDRMACTGIFRQYRHKAVVNKWYSSDASTDLPVTGSLEFYQDSSYDMTHTHVDLAGLEGSAGGYHVHMVSVPPGLQFPCTNNIVYGHYNPHNTASVRYGTPDQFEIGDLSGKYGMLNGKKELAEQFNDTNLPLFGAHSILGRSIVIHKPDGKRWACGSIGWGFSPSEAKEIKAIASFHNPAGFLYGYIKLSQVVYYDGSTTDTTIEVNLRYPGKNNRNQTTGHNWALYVNPVGYDATVKHFPARCVAAGYRWNPYLVQLAAPYQTELYKLQCGPDAPRRCEVGDLGGRHGPIDVGKHTAVFNDINLPLAGQYSAVGKSIVVHTKAGGEERLACANIQEEKSLVKWASILRSPSFTVDGFVEHVREVIGATEWMIAPDMENVQQLHSGQCVQLLLHFMGPQSDKLEQAFNRLLAGGKLEQPVLHQVGQPVDKKRPKKLKYKPCQLNQNTGRYAASSNTVSPVVLLTLSCVVAQVLL